MPLKPAQAKIKFEDIKNTVLDDCYQVIDRRLINNITDMEKGSSVKVNIIKYLMNYPHDFSLAEIEKFFIPTIIKVYQEWLWDVSYNQNKLEFSIKKEKSK